MKFCHFFFKRWAALEVWLPLAVHCSSWAGFLFWWPCLFLRGGVWGSVSSGNTSPRASDKVDCGTFDYTFTRMWSSIAQRVFLVAICLPKKANLPSQEGGKSIFSLLAWLTRTISMKRLTQIESIHSNQRACIDGVSPILPARAVCQSS